MAITVDLHRPDRCSSRAARDVGPHGLCRTRRPVGRWRYVVLVGIIVGYPVAFETFTRGRSLGKLAVGLRVVRDDGGAAPSPGPRSGPVRGSSRSGCSRVPAICAACSTAGASASVTSLAGTVVVRERLHSKPRSSPPALDPDPQTLGWAASADLSRVGDGLALAMRQFLARAATSAPRPGRCSAISWPWTSAAA